jgi:IclR family transcriptional regulator, acetate operon repressor
MPTVATGVQSVERAFELLEVLAPADGELGISELSATSGLPLPTIHRLVRTLVGGGYVRQLPNRKYALGSRLIRIGEVASGQLGVWARPLLHRLVDELGESANVAMLDGDRAVYVGQVPSRHSMRMFTEVGRRVALHCTGVGKALLSQLPDREVRDILARAGMPALTPNTLTEADELVGQLGQIRRRGYAIDEGEQEIGVRCVAVPVTEGSTRLAVSVSGPVPRMTAELIGRAVPMLQAAAGHFGDELAARSSA